MRFLEKYNSIHVSLENKKHNNNKKKLFERDIKIISYIVLFAVKIHIPFMNDSSCATQMRLFVKWNKNKNNN